MDHSDHVSLLRPADLAPGGVWADLGAGAGAFTLALRELLGPEAEIYAIDRDQTRLDDLRAAYTDRFGAVERLRILRADFSRALPQLPRLDGVLMANSLHFFRKKQGMLERIGGLVNSGGRLLLVEYNAERGNIWVPYPISFSNLKSLLQASGFSEPRLLGTHASRFLKEIYSAEARRLS